MNGRRIPALDALRGFAALTVAISHYLVYRAFWSGQAEAASALAVEIFFTLSGFVLAPQIIHCLDSGALATLRVFLVRRWMRTIPSYLVALTAITILVGEIDPRDLMRYSLYVQNLFEQSNRVDYYPVAWSLSVEEWFYLVFPALLMLMARLSPRSDGTLIAATTIAFIVVVSLVRDMLGDFEAWGPEVRRSVVFRVDAIAWGVALYLLLARTDRLMAPRGLHIGGAAAAVVLFTGLTIATLLRIGTVGGALEKHAFPYIASFLGASVIWLCALLNRSIEQRSQFRELGAFFGRVSYPVYLFHLPILMILAQWTNGVASLAEFAIYLCLLIFFCAVFHAIFEKPILAARPRYKRDSAIDTSSIRPQAVSPVAQG